MNEQMIEKIKQLINNRYNHVHCGWTDERSRGNSMDVFQDGYDCGESTVLYEIGCILGMELEEPDKPDEQE